MLRELSPNSNVYTFMSVCGCACTTDQETNFFSLLSVARLVLGEEAGLDPTDFKKRIVFVSGKAPRLLYPSITFLKKIILSS